MRHLAMIADALGVARDESHDCPLCGESPFGPGAPLGENFCDVDLLAGEGLPCAGCARVMGGRPGDDPPPLRTVSFVVRAGALSALDRPGLWAELWSPDFAPRVISWAASRKKHHALRAGVSRDGVLLVGADGQTIRIDVDADRQLGDAVVALLGSPTGVGSILSRDSIRSGDYHPAAIERFGVAQWRTLEALVAPRRPSGLLDLLTYCAPIGPPPREESSVIDPHDASAAWLLAKIATSSQQRRDDGLNFWRGFFRHRLERCRRMPLAELVSRLTDSLRCDVLAPEHQAAVRWLATSDEQACGNAAHAIKSRPGYLVALAYDQIKQAKTAEKVAE